MDNRKESLSVRRASRQIGRLRKLSAARAAAGGNAAPSSTTAANPYAKENYASADSPPPSNPYAKDNYSPASIPEEEESDSGSEADDKPMGMEDDWWAADGSGGADVSAESIGLPSAPLDASVFALKMGGGGSSVNAGRKSTMMRKQSSRRKTSVRIERISSCFQEDVGR